MKSRSIPSLRLSRTTSTTTKKGSKTSRTSLNISAPITTKIDKDVNIDSLTHRKDFTSLMDQLVYFAFGVDEAKLLEDMAEEKQLYFKKQLNRFNCQFIIDDKISRIFEINFNKDSYICFYGPNSKLFDLFRLIIYMNIYNVNSIKTQLKLTSQENDVLLFLPLVFDENYNRKYEDDHSTLARLMSTKNIIPENEVEHRKRIEDEEYQRKVDEIDRKHKEFLAQNGLLIQKDSQQNLKTIMSKNLNELKLRGEKLEELSDETEIIEVKSQSFLNNVKQLKKLM